MSQRELTRKYIKKMIYCLHKTFLLLLIYTILYFSALHRFMFLVLNIYYFFFPPFVTFFFGALFGFAPDGLAALGFFETTFLTVFFLGAAFVLVVFLTPRGLEALAAAFFLASTFALGILIKSKMYSYAGE